jgi:hypothetical protein
VLLKQVLYQITAKMSDSRMMRYSFPLWEISVPEYFHCHRLIFFAGAYCNNKPLLGFLFGRVGDDDPAGSLLFSCGNLNDHPVSQWFNTYFAHIDLGIYRLIELKMISVLRLAIFVPDRMF